MKEVQSGKKQGHSGHVIRWLTLLLFQHISSVQCMHMLVGVPVCVHVYMGCWGLNPGAQHMLNKWSTNHITALALNTSESVPLYRGIRFFQGWKSHLALWKAEFTMYCYQLWRRISCVHVCVGCWLPNRRRIWANIQHAENHFWEFLNDLRNLQFSHFDNNTKHP